MVESRHVVQTSPYMHVVSAVVLTLAEDSAAPSVPHAGLNLAGRETAPIAGTSSIGVGALGINLGQLATAQNVIVHQPDSTVLQ